MNLSLDQEQSKMESSGEAKRRSDQESVELVPMFSFSLDRVELAKELRHSFARSAYCMSEVEVHSDRRTIDKEVKKGC